MKRFKKIYVEISNICNLFCSFCPGTTRAKRQMNLEEFSTVISKIKQYTDYVYPHVLGEPLLHPSLNEFLKICHDNSLKVIITTNGTLLKEKAQLLLNSEAVHKIVISLHSFEANDSKHALNQYLDDCFAFAKESEGKKIIALRLWNDGGANRLNDEILNRLELFFKKPWTDSRNGAAVGNKVFLQYGEQFEWPSLDSTQTNDKIFCHALRDHIGILADGTVVPCCLDNNGSLALGNIFTEELDDILSSQKAINIYDGFSQRKAPTKLCERCSFSRKF